MIVQYISQQFTDICGVWIDLQHAFQNSLGSVRKKFQNRCQL